MGIRDRIKKRLPIVGAGGNISGTGKEAEASAPAQAAAPSPAPSQSAAPAAANDGRGEQDVQGFIGELVKTNKIVLFMKGNPSSPMCGFSANAVGILQQYGKPIAHFDILSDPEVRQGVKEFSQWPTLPQIYVGGEFLGGSDILIQMHGNGELKDAIEAAHGE